jgi:5-methylcytosine-specific restriction endonuclease McrA
MTTNSTEYQRSYYQRNREKMLAQNRAYRLAHPRDRREQGRAYYRSNKARIDAKNLANYWANRSSCLERSRRYSRSIVGKFSSLCGDAKRRKIAQAITLGQYAELLKNRCFYCGTSVDDTTGSSLDRKDSAQEYSIANVVVCCWTCNKIKSDVMTMEEMIVVIKALKEFRERRV